MFQDTSSGAEEDAECLGKENFKHALGKIQRTSVAKLNNNFLKLTTKMTIVIFNPTQAWKMP